MATKSGSGTPVEEWFAEEEARDPGFRAFIDEASERSRLALMVKKLREGAGLSQAALAEKCGLLQPSVARIERGKGMPKIDILMKVARACDAELVLEFKALAPSRKKKPRA